MHTLYVVATPIGNLEDITLRALRVLQEVGIIAAEDTRTTRKLLRRHNIRTPLVSYYEGNRFLRIPFLLERLLEGDVALVSDAGMPGIRDPGYELLRAAIQAGVPVVPLPGASAVTTALAASGLPGDQFLFLGFLPSRRKERLQSLQRVSRQPYTLVLFEAPHRLRASLEDMAEALGSDRRVAVCRELTKLYEEIYRGTISEALAHFVLPRGEFTLVIAGAEEQKGSEEVTLQDVVEGLRKLRASGVAAREAVAQVMAQYGLPRRQVYQMWLELGG
ncbi:MAG: 16S rRNA (cytidine(1402)-2'-O)-methyltransferase [Dehalococcoidia bacterium]|nr:16S rRNA (cytidine(1402)-2'-O)-methyltransferase [Dehalococcoidia bacterium]